MSQLTRTSRIGLPFALGGVAALAISTALYTFAFARPAYAQIPDSGAQRNEMIQELKTSNQKLAEIAGLLREIRELQAAAAKDKSARPATSRP